MNRNGWSEKTSKNKQTNHRALSKHKTSQRNDCRRRKNSISIKYIGIKCDSLKSFVYTQQATATAAAAITTSQPLHIRKNTFVLSISFFNMKMCVPTLEQINVLLLYFVALSLSARIYVYNSSACCTNAHIATVERCLAGASARYFSSLHSE